MNYTDLAEHITPIVVFLGFVVIASLSGFGWFIKKQVQIIDDVKKEQVEIKYNYLSRFEEIKDIINKNHLIIVQKLDSQETSIRVIEVNCANQICKKL